MTDSIRIVRAPEMTWPPKARPIAVMIVAVALALLATACSGRPASTVGSPSAGGTTTSSSVVGFSRCMRSHGVPNFPDPDSDQTIPKITPQQLGVSSSQYQAAQTACSDLLRPAVAQVQQTLAGMRDFALCMRSRGVHDWPDPTTDPDDTAVFDLRGRINPDTPQVETASTQCAPVLHPVPGQDGTVLCNGIGEDGCHHYG